MPCWLAGVTMPSFSYLLPVMYPASCCQDIYELSLAHLGIADLPAWSGAHSMHYCCMHYCYTCINIHINALYMNVNLHAYRPEWLQYVHGATWCIPHLPILYIGVCFVWQCGKCVSWLSAHISIYPVHSLCTCVYAYMACMQDFVYTMYLHVSKVYVHVGPCM